MKTHLAVYPLKHSADIARRIRALDEYATIHPRAMIARNNLPIRATFTLDDIRTLQADVLDIHESTILCNVVESQLTQTEVTRLVLSVYQDPNTLNKEKVMSEVNRNHEHITQYTPKTGGSSCS